MNYSFSVGKNVLFKLGYTLLELKQHTFIASVSSFFSVSIVASTVCKDGRCSNAHVFTLSSTSSKDKQGHFLFLKPLKSGPCKITNNPICCVSDLFQKDSFSRTLTKQLFPGNKACREDLEKDVIGIVAVCLSAWPRIQTQAHFSLTAEIPLLLANFLRPADSF